jgi:8-oxo-dGTP diphosphatase
MKEIAVVCAILERDGLFLAAQRGPHTSHAGLWEFPGGKIRAHESARAALKREIQEELGVEITLHKKLAPVRHAYDAFSILLTPFVAEIASGRLNPHEHQAIQWVNVAQAKKLSWTAADVPVLKEYLVVSQSH